MTHSFVLRVALISSAAAAALAAQLAPAPPTAELSNGELEIKVYLPDARNGYYRGTRFDWSGVVYSLRHQGHEFYGPWFQRMDPSVHDFIYSGDEIVAGPCSAIPGPVDEFRPVGFESAKAGGTFVKIGVGVLRKPDGGKYDNYRLYQIADGGKWTVRKLRDRIEFTQQLADIDSGYSYVYRKSVRLGQGTPEMFLEYSLKNTGQRAIETSVYNHNFLIMDGQAPGPGLAITAPFDIETSRPPNAELAQVQGKQISYLKTLTGKDVVSCPVEGFSIRPDDHQFRIENTKLGIGMSLEGNRALQRVGLWSIRSVMALEPFIAVTVQPGNEFTWKNTYRYYKLGPAR